MADKIYRLNVRDGETTIADASIIRETGARYYPGRFSGFHRAYISKDEMHKIKKDSSLDRFVFFTDLDDAPEYDRKIREMIKTEICGKIKMLELELALY